jgi:O-antigen biosynthesis protein
MSHGPGGLVRKLRADGPRALGARLARRAYDALDGARLESSLLPGDVADRLRLDLPVATPRAGGRPLHIGWVTTPPGAGSGGHTTMFRMVEACERAGHRCTVLLYDRHHGDAAAHAAVVRRCWPGVRADVRAVGAGAGALDGLDVAVATSWPTAHVLATRPAPVHRAYFVQDYEPFFHPHGDVHALAADTYRFGFHVVALGTMVRERLAEEVGVAAACVPFSCDTTVYGLRNTGHRAGVVLYAKRGNARRGFDLGLRTLAELHRLRPDQPIHLYGDPVPELDLPVVRHGRLSPVALDALYNSVSAGLALSFTNISLVAEEMLASGVVPVVNDSRDARADLPSAIAAWAEPTPSALAEALCRVLDHPEPGAQARAAAASVRTDDWRLPGAALVAELESLAAGRVPVGGAR